MPNLLRDISKGLISGHFDHLANWITLKRELLNACGFQQNEADITNILNSENHKALSTTFRDIFQKVPFSAILDAFGLVTWEAVGFWTCGFRLNVVHTSLYMDPRNKKDMIWSYAEPITRYLEGSDFGPIWPPCKLNNSEMRTFECMWFAGKWGRHNPRTQFRKA